MGGEDLNNAPVLVILVNLRTLSNDTATEYWWEKCQELVFNAN